MFLVVSGKMNSGKDTIISGLIKRFPNHKFIRVGFADYLKDICVNLFNLQAEVLYSSDKSMPTQYLWKNMPWYRWWKHWNKRNSYISHREFLQYFGTEICRQINNDCWVDYLLKKCNDNNVIYCLADVRFFNEATKLIKSHQAIILRLTRNPYDSKHISETALDKFVWLPDEIVDNKNLSIEEATNRAIECFNSQSIRHNLGIKLC